MSQQTAKRIRRQFAIGFSHVSPQQRKYSRRVPSTALRKQSAGSGKRK